MRLPAGGGAEDSRGLFWILDEEVRVEGSQDSVVLERLCAASEKKGAGAEGEGGNRGGGGAPLLLIITPGGSWTLSPQSPDKACTRGAVHLPGCVPSFIRVLIHS